MRQARSRFSVERLPRDRTRDMIAERVLISTVSTWSDETKIMTGDVRQINGWERWGAGSGRAAAKEGG
jgi:hypothetical protein